MPKILYINSGAEDYLADSLLHGLRGLLGSDLVDFPRRDSMYEVIDPASVYGRGFTLYGTLEDVDVRRGWALDRALDGEFDVVVFADIARNWGPWAQFQSRLLELRRRGTVFVALDGADDDVLFPHGLATKRGWRPWPIPRVTGRAVYYKRELTPRTARTRYLGMLPQRLAERLLSRSVRPIAFSIPATKIVAVPPEKTQTMARHVVDPEVAAIVPHAQSSYAFQTEDDYVEDLRRSRFAVTMKRSGWDCMRHYEQAAAGCVPCFRNLHAKPPTCAPHGLDETNCVIYTTAEHLMSQISTMTDDEYRQRQAGALAWVRENTTEKRAAQVLADIEAARRPVRRGGLISKVINR